ncbi:TIGR04282 family arsenosugar biosynthesis glycosyltransferase [Shimia biformata]|uniref:TIGR04282 family arsenosugar biosynthesis glycosyltransferase n=1 Tax=Shimia biformata TaxID=1294299 RepID=UPI001951CE60|nr:TIGR04282 family arsenosugar biosynthesis glycosyltransferase [Shimia biformata]
MVKEPRPGRVKTRLGQDIGMTGAAWWFRQQTARLLRRITDPRWETILAVSPDVEGLHSRIWPPTLPRVPQGPGDLGGRMGRLLRGLPPGPTCIIGADIPGITPAHIARAFAALGNNDAVFGPATDGGYWLIGLKRTAPPPATLFDNVRWSTEHALTDTLATLPGRTIALIDTLDDVDTYQDLLSLSPNTSG